MKKVLFLLVVLMSSKVFSQVYQKNYLFDENFSSKSSGNNWSIVNNSTYTANIINGKYFCYLPYRNNMGWNWTWINIPDDLTQIFNQSTEINLDLDFTFEDNINYNNFGLMFDLHNVTDNCPGGSFYELYFTKVNDEIKTAFRKNDNCNLGEKKFFKQGSAVTLQNLNHLTIQKNGLNWTIFVNTEIVLQLNFNGNILLNKLRYNMGKYSFDNFSAYSTTVKLPDEPQITNNPSLLPKIWALCVGIENYSNYPGYPKYINNLNSCIDDAQSYHSFLSSFQGGKVPFNQLLLLTDKQATNSNILLKANELFAKASENDLVIVFLSGHGGSGYYCASNDALRYEELNKILENSKAKRKLLIADACHSGTWAKQRDVFSPKGEKLTDDEALQLFYNELSKSSQNVTYLLASKPDELSWETNGHGVFTYYLVKGLSCNAKAKDSPIISIEDIYNYLSTNVYNATKNYHLDNGMPSPQHPVLEGKYDKRMPVSICNE